MLPPRTYHVRSILDKELFQCAEYIGSVALHGVSFGITYTTHKYLVFRPKSLRFTDSVDLVAATMPTVHYPSTQPFIWFTPSSLNPAPRLIQKTLECHSCYHHCNNFPGICACTHTCSQLSRSWLSITQKHHYLRTHSSLQ